MTKHCYETRPDTSVPPPTPPAAADWPAKQFPGAAGGRPRPATPAIKRRDGHPLTA